METIHIIAIVLLICSAIAFAINLILMKEECDIDILIDEDDGLVFDADSFSDLTDDSMDKINSLTEEELLHLAVTIVVLYQSLESKAYCSEYKRIGTTVIDANMTIIEAIASNLEQCDFRNADITKCAVRRADG